MASPPADSLNDRAGFVIIPISLLAHPKLTDCDIRILLTLDLMGWREGSRDGVIRASNQEIGDRAHKKVTAVCDSLRRLKSIRPPIIKVDMRTKHTRDAITLAYDRFGGVVGNPGTVTGNPTTSYRKSDNQVVGNPTTHPVDIRGIEVAAADSEVVGFPTTSPLTLAALIEWLPTITNVQADLVRLNRLAAPWVAWVARHCPQHAALAPEWVQDAILTSSEAEDIVSYSRKILKAWVGAGGRPDFELASKPKAVPDETDTPAPTNGVHKSQKLGYGDRTRADQARFLASIDTAFDQELDS